MHNNEPKNEVLRLWKLSFPIRQIASLSPQEFFDQWPILRTQAAIDLVRYYTFIVNVIVSLS